MKKCGLPGPEIIEIEIKKERSEQLVLGEIIIQSSKFRMISSDAEVFVNCNDGFIDNLKTKGPAEDCGIEEILIQLCMNEAEIHNVDRKKNDGFLVVKNWALYKLKEYIQECEVKDLCRKNDELIRRLKGLKNG